MFGRSKRAVTDGLQVTGQDGPGAPGLATNR